MASHRAEESAGLDEAGAGRDEPAIDLAAMRENYTLSGLDEADLAGDWLTQFQRWLAQAVEGGLTEPNAMVLATATPAGEPATRTVLAKAVDADGVSFYTNYGSDKSHDLDGNPVAAVTFPWLALQRQVNIRGRVERLDADTVAAYWAVRPRISQIGAWSSPQSTVVADRAELDHLQELVEQRFGDRNGTDPIPVPPQWGGWLLRPDTVEFWQGRSGRMHDRLRYRRVDDAWVVERLAP